MNYNQILAAYIFVHILTFVYVRYHVMKNHYRLHCQPDFKGVKEQFGPFLRPDINKPYTLHILWSFPWYCTFWPRFCLSWLITGTCTFIVLFYTYGEKNVLNLSETKTKIVKRAI